MLAAPINGAVKALRALGLKDLDVLLFNKGVENTLYLHLLVKMPGTI